MRRSMDLFCKTGTPPLFMLIVSLIIEWSCIISDIFLNRQPGGLYCLYAFGPFLISWFFYNCFPLGMDNILDILVDGQIFTPPRFFSILVPIFLIFTEKILEFIRKHHRILQGCGKQTLQIAEQIIKALLNFFQFVTGDYLTPIIELTQEDEDIADHIQLLCCYHVPKMIWEPSSSS